jgi:iron complex outermembrane receptor protein
MAGGELSYSVGLSREWLLLGGLSYTRGTKAINPQAKILDHDFAEMPPLKSRTALRFGRKKFFGELEGLAVNAQNHVDADLLETRTPGYFILSFKGGIRFEKMRFTAGVENLFNRYYYEHFSYQRDPFRSGVRVPEPGRTLYVVWEYRF